MASSKRQFASVPDWLCERIMFEPDLDTKTVFSIAITNKRVYQLSAPLREAAGKLLALPTKECRLPLRRLFVRLYTRRWARGEWFDSRSEQIEKDLRLEKFLEQMLKVFE